MHLQLNVRREVLFLFLYIFLSNMALINEGATQGYSAVVLPILMSNTSSLTLNKMEILFFASTVSITPFIGSLLCLITMHYGRRCTMIVCGVNFFLGWTLIASSYNVTQLFIGRILTGIPIGLASPSIEIYLAEISIPAWREVATITPNIGVSVGVLLIYILGFVAQDNWRLIAAFFTIPSITLVLCNIFFLHESPMWLLLKGRKEAAKIALLRIRGLLQETIEFQEEFIRMENYNALTNDLKTSENCQIDSTTETGKKSFLTNISNKLKNIRRIILLPEVWKPIVILNFFFFFQRFSGTYVIIYYCVDVISKINITIDPFLITVIVGIIEVILNIISACCSMR
ncbi:TRET1 protein, partial [Acromyrmex charruanus]